MGTVAGAEVADHAAGDQRLHDGVGALVAGQADLRAASCVVIGRHAAQALAGAELIDGTPRALDRGMLAFAPDTTTGSGVAIKHAHSRDNPEADWGRHVRQAAEFALQALDEALPHAAPFTFANTRVIAVGLSNGGGAVLRAAELEGDWLDAVVAGEPNVFVDGHGGRSLYDYTTEAALLMPCALLHLDGLPQPPARDRVEAAALLRCEALQAAGLVERVDPAAQDRKAHV